MAGNKTFTELSELTTVDKSNDWMAVVDVSDTSASTYGTSKKANVDQFIGDTGVKGDTGAVGSTGADSTIAGPKGDTGITGDTGVGQTGDTGADSTVAGPKGDTGITGDTGVGQTGDTGADSTVAGPKGDTGVVGATGVQGDTGSDSTVAGPKGDTGVVGDTGVGVKGDTGATGPNNITTSTTTNLTGVITGNGSNIGSATKPTGAIVGTTDTQTLSGKTLSSPLFQGTWDGWIDLNATCTYASSTTFIISGDYTGILQNGDKIKLTQTAAKYFYIVGVSYSSPNTTVTVTGGNDYSLANATITSPYFSKIETPQGFPSSFEFSPTITASSGTITTASGSVEFSIRRGLVTISGVIGVTNIGTGSEQLRATLPVTPATYGCGVGRENSVVGVSIHLYIAPSVGYLTAFKYDGSSCVVNNYSIRFSVSYYI